MFTQILGKSQILLLEQFMWCVKECFRWRLLDVFSVSVCELSNYKSVLWYGFWKVQKIKSLNSKLIILKRIEVLNQLNLQKKEEHFRPSVQLRVCCARSISYDPTQGCWWSTPNGAEIELIIVCCNWIDWLLRFLRRMLAPSQIYGFSFGLIKRLVYGLGF